MNTKDVYMQLMASNYWPKWNLFRNKNSNHRFKLFPTYIVKGNNQLMGDLNVQRELPEIKVFKKKKTFNLFGHQHKYWCEDSLGKKLKDRKKYARKIYEHCE